jgi:acid phosphatase
VAGRAAARYNVSRRDALVGRPMRSKIPVILWAVLALAAVWLWQYRASSIGAVLADVPRGYTPRLDDPVAEGDRGRFLCVFAMGDFGTDDWRQRRVARAMEHVASDGGVDQVLLLGDLFYRHGVRSVDDPRWTSGFQEMYRGALLETTFRPALGNHDYDGNIEAVVAFAERDPRWAMEGRYYRFALPLPDDDGSADFFALDTVGMILDPADRAAQLEWLATGLGSSEARWKVVFGHHPIDSGGIHGGEPALVADLVPVLVRHEVDFYLAGHDHHLALMAPIDGVHPIVSGAGGKLRDAEWTDTTLFARAELGFCELLLGPDAAFVRFFDSAGDLLTSHRVAPRIAAASN